MKIKVENSKQIIIDISERKSDSENFTSIPVYVIAYNFSLHNQNLNKSKDIL